MNETPDTKTIPGLPASPDKPASLLQNEPTPTQSAVQRLFDQIHTKFPTFALSTSADASHVVVEISTDNSISFFTSLKSDQELGFNFLVDLTVVDYLDSRSCRFEVVYHLLSIQHNWRVRVKIAVRESSASVPSIVSLWSGANFMEREAWDMYGIRFEGHPDLRRILMYDEFKGHPLRKDYPIQLKQPRVALRKPEVENTARNMHRPDLVAITPRRKVAEDSSKQPTH